MLEHAFLILVIGYKRDKLVIGISKTNDNIRAFHKYVEKRSISTCKSVKKQICSLDNVSGLDEERTYENGCNFLLSWFNSLN